MFPVVFRTDGEWRLGCGAIFAYGNDSHVTKMRLRIILELIGAHVFQQTIGIPMGTSCAPLLADLFLYSYEADFILGLLK